jgi:hypothetical protein
MGFKQGSSLGMNGALNSHGGLQGIVENQRFRIGTRTGMWQSALQSAAASGFCLKGIDYLLEIDTNL